MTKFKKITAVLLCLVLCSFLTVPAFAVQEYKITSPYDGVDWSKTTAYKTALHSHTNASDGDQTLKQSLERHAQSDFDIVSITDHGTVDYTWSKDSKNMFIHTLFSALGKSEGKLEYLGQSGTFENGEAYTYSSENGDDYLNVSGKKILRIPYGIENNAISVNAHVNSWFVDYHDNTITTYEDAVKGVDSLGGLCVINHPGEYTKARYELHSSDAYNQNNTAYKYYTDKYASLIENYSACIGIDINSKGDTRTLYDRILWDKLLERFSSNGKNVYAIASSDAHQLEKIDTGYTVLLMQEQTSAQVKEALSEGRFFAASHCIGNYDELAQIAASLKEYYGENDETYVKVNDAATQIKEKVESIESGKLKADSSIGITYSVLDEDGFCTAKTHPQITSISTNSLNGTISLNAENALLVRWISGGKLIATTKGGNSVLDLSTVSEKLGNYVRAEVFGEGGILYTQAFLIKSEKTQPQPVVSESFKDYGIIDFIFAHLNNWFEVIVRFFKNLF
ncbi:MAG: PHP-associated domain-containing protein [Acutalibacteraceae bacterium]